MPSNDPRDLSTKDLVKAVLLGMKGAGFCFMKEKELKEIHQAIGALTEEMAHNTVCIEDIHDILNCNEKEKK